MLLAQAFALHRPSRCRAALPAARAAGLRLCDRDAHSAAPLSLVVSSPALLLNHVAERYSSTSRILMEFVDNSLDDADWRDAAASAASDSVRSGTLTRMRPAGGSTAERAELLERATTADVDAVDRATVPRVDIHDEVERVRGGARQLMQTAAVADAEVAETPAEQLRALIQQVAVVD